MMMNASQNQTGVPSQRTVRGSTMPYPVCQPGGATAQRATPPGMCFRLVEQLLKEALAALVIGLVMALERRAIVRLLVLGRRCLLDRRRRLCRSRALDDLVELPTIKPH